MGGGSPSPAPAAPTSSNVYQTNIPEYAQPYVMNMLQSAQSQIYNPTTGAINPYVPYSTNPSDYIAGFSPLQQQAQSTAANLQVPGQYGAATGLTGLSALQSGRLAGQMAGAGQQYAQQATNPYAMQAYMNPYVQASLQPQLNLLGQQTGIQTAAEQAAATSAGAFGGTREALMNTLQQQAGNLAAQQAIGQGYNQAFQQAQQAQQFGAGLGLQGQQAALGAVGQQGAMGAQLAGIGGQQLAAQQGIIGTQAQQGAAQQAQQQAIINQAVQNYATAQQYPMQQLANMSALLRGLPMQQTTVQTYAPVPSAAQQATGLLGSGALLAGALSKKAGGSIKEKKVPGYRYGGIMSPEEFDYKAEQLPDSQLNMVKGLPGVNPGEQMTLSDVQADRSYLRSNPSAGMPPPVPPTPQQALESRLTGIAGPGTPTVGPRTMAGGGIIAFNGENDDQLVGATDVPTQSQFFRNLPTKIGQMFTPPVAPKVRSAIDPMSGDILSVPTSSYQLQDESQRGIVTPAQTAYSATAPQVDTTSAAPEEAAKPSKKDKEAKTAAKAADKAVAGKPSATSPEGILAQRQSMLESLGIKPGMTADEQALLEHYRKMGGEDELNRNLMFAGAKALADFGSTAAPGGAMQAASMAIGKNVPEFEKAYAHQAEAQRLGMEGAAKLQEAQRKYAEGDVDGAMKLYEEFQKNQTQLQVANIHANAANQAGRLEEAHIARIMQENPGMTYTQALQTVKGAGRAESSDITALKELGTLAQNNLYSPDKKVREKAAADLIEIQKQLQRRIQQSAGLPKSASATPEDIQSILDRYKS